MCVCARTCVCCLLTLQRRILFNASAPVITRMLYLVLLDTFKSGDLGKISFPYIFLLLLLLFVCLVFFIPFVTGCNVEVYPHPQIVLPQIRNRSLSLCEEAVLPDFMLSVTCVCLRVCLRKSEKMLVPNYTRAMI